MRNLDAWLTGDLDARRFPYPEVLAAYHWRGKHFVSKDLLDALNEVRSRADDLGGPDEAVHQLTTFLAIALDKFDGRYDYQTYLALPLLPMPNPDSEVAPEVAGRERDRLVAQLLADLLRFELTAASGASDLMPKQRPNGSLVAKRLHLGVRAALPALRRVGLAEPAAQPVATAHRLCASVEAASGVEDRQVLALSMLPVADVHDEYLFIRVLQCWEATFALLAVHLSATRSAIACGDGSAGARQLHAAASTLRESAPLFSLLATMQVQSFRTFREWTEGASAIQSRNYKIVESLCRTPDRKRIDSLAYTSVPELREQVLAGRPTIEQSYVAAAKAGLLPASQHDLIQHAMRTFAGALSQWRQTHYRLAMRMLGGRSGTGYTEGPPYLDAVRKIPVFELPPLNAAVGGPAPAHGSSTAERGQLP